MPLPAGRLIPPTMLFVAMLGCPLVRPLSAQKISVHAGGSDSVSWIVPRAQLDEAQSTLRTSNRRAALLLMDSTIVLQFTNRGMAHVKRSIEEEPGSVGERFFARLVGAGVLTLLDHGIAYRLDAIGKIRSEGTRLVLEDRQGRRVFDDVNVNDEKLLESFNPEEAERFADAVNRARRRQ